MRNTIIFNEAFKINSNLRGDIPVQVRRPFYASHSCVSRDLPILSFHKTFCMRNTNGQFKRTSAKKSINSSVDYKEKLKALQIRHQSTLIAFDKLLTMYEKTHDNWLKSIEDYNSLYRQEHGLSSSYQVPEPPERLSADINFSSLN